MPLPPDSFEIGPTFTVSDKQKEMVKDISPLWQGYVGKAPKRSDAGLFCGCRVITFDKRCTIAVPCDAHVGRLEVTVKVREAPSVPSDTPECPA